MKILHYSDYPDRQIAGLFAQCDVMFTTGDLSIFDLRPIENDLTTKPGFGVYGNHCVPGYLEELKITNVHLQVVEFSGYSVGGYQGSPRYKDGGGPQFTEEEAESDLRDYPAVDILLLHAAPFGLLDTPNDPVHIGSKVVRDYVDRTSPKYIFCGHDSPSKDMKYGKTKIFRTHQSRLLDIPSKESQGI